MPTENLTYARVRGLKPEHGEITDIKSGMLVRATQGGVIASFSFRYRTGEARRRIVDVDEFVSLADARGCGTNSRSGS